MQFDWSLAVHAYGNASKSDWGLHIPYQAYTFSDLPKVRSLLPGLMSHVCTCLWRTFRHTI